MKYVLLVVAVLAVYYFLGRSAPMKPVAQAASGQEAAALATGPREPAPAATTNALKRPLDRTHEVLGQVQQRNGNGEF